MRVSYSITPKLIIGRVWRQQCSQREEEGEFQYIFTRQPKLTQVNDFHHLTFMSLNREGGRQTFVGPSSTKDCVGAKYLFDCFIISFLI